MFQYLEIAGTYDILQPPERIIKTQASPATKQPPSDIEAKVI
jgi:hypothetical protein